MEYLISLGHRSIGFIGGHPELQSAVRRLQGYEDGLRQANIHIDPELIQTGDYSTEAAFLCAQKLLNLSDPPTAVFAPNDQSTIGVLGAAQEAGLRVPDDLSVVRSDNIPVRWRCPRGRGLGAFSKTFRESLKFERRWLLN